MEPSRHGISTKLSKAPQSDREGISFDEKMKLAPFEETQGGTLKKQVPTGPNPGTPSAIISLKAAIKQTFKGANPQPMLAAQQQRQTEVPTTATAPK